MERGDVSCADKAEVKRREIRRRLLLGGSAVVPIIITTINPRRAFAASELVCRSLLGITEAQDPDAGQEVSMTFWCNP